MSLGMMGSQIGMKLGHYINKHPALFGVGLGISYWIIDSIVASLLITDSSVFTQIVNPGSPDLYRRLLVLMLLVTFSAIIIYSIGSKDNGDRDSQIEEEIKQRNIELAALNAIAATVSRTLDINEILNNALDDVIQLDFLGGEAHGMIFLLNETTGELLLTAHRGVPKDHPCLTIPPKMGECLCGLAVTKVETIISEDCFEDKRHTRNWSDMPHHKDICLPMIVRGKILGVMNVKVPGSKEITGNLVQLLVSVADQVSVAIENAQLFEAVDVQRSRLRVLSARLAERESVERKRISRELHDRVGQNLSALGINLNIIRTQISEGDLNIVNSYLVESEVLVEQTSERIRDVLAELRPPMLDDYGLLAALCTFCSQFTARVGLAVNVKGSDSLPRLSFPIENAFFRIATEALTNVAKHANATQALLTLDVENNTYRMIISDDGIGFHPERLADLKANKGWGLLTMSERAEAIGGRFSIESDPSLGGTRVVAEVEL